MALITALMPLSFLTIVGGALLSSTTVDMRIGMNYRTNAQLLMLTESGIEAARESFRSDVEAKIDADASDTIDTLSEGITEVLKDLDGTDALLSASLDVDTLMDATATEDIRYGDSIPLLAGAVTIETYTVFVPNDVADGATSTTDTCEVVTIVSIGVIDNSEMLIEVDRKKNRYPDVPAALTLDGSVEWNGLVMVVDPAECDTTPAQGTHYVVTLGGGTQINGGLFIASTYNNTLNDVCININGCGTGGVTYDSAKISNASGSMPFTPIAITHF